MKKIVIWLFSLLPVSALAQNNFQITVKIPGYNPSFEVHLFSKIDGKEYHDSTKIVNGMASLSGHVNEPVQGVLAVMKPGSPMILKRSAANYRIFYLEPGKINVAAIDSLKNATVTGSISNDEYNHLQQMTAGVTAEMEQIEMAYSNARIKKDSLALKTLKQQMFDTQASELKIFDRFIHENPDSFVDFSLLNEMVFENYPASGELFNQLSPRLKATNRGKQIESSVTVAQVGSSAPLFTQNDTAGHPVSLTAFKGKYVLVDFWASWCLPCRAENPNVVAAYHKFRDKNFTIISVSLDGPDGKKAWLAAIKKDGLDWTNVSDLAYYKNAVAIQYGVHVIPENFLIDPSGKIIAKNIRGEELAEKLKDLLH